MGDRPEENEQAEGGWAVGCSATHVVSSTGGHIFFSAIGDKMAQHTSIATKPVRAILPVTAADGTAFWLLAGDEKVVEVRDAAMNVTHTSAPFQKKIGQIAYIGAPHNKVLVGDKTGDVFEIGFDLASGFGEAKFSFGHTASMITGMHFCFGGKLLATTDKDEHVRLTRYPATHIIERFCFGHDSFVSSLVEISDELIATSGGDGQVRVWKLPSGESVFDEIFEGKTVHDLTVAVDASGAQTLLASVDTVGIVAYSVAALAKGKVLSTRAPTSLASSGSTVFAAFIGDSGPFVQKFQLSGTTLTAETYELPVALPSVQPSYWQVC